MGRLSSAVGMSKSGLYAHFESKEELQVATVEHAVAVFDEEVLLGSTEHVDRDLAPLLRRWLAFFERRVFPGGCFLIVSAVEFAHRPGSVRDVLERAVDHELAVLEEAIQRAEVSAELDARQTAFELHCILMNAHALFQIEGEPAVFARARAAMVRLVGELDGL